LEAQGLTGEGKRNTDSFLIFMTCPAAVTPSVTLDTLSEDIVLHYVLVLLSRLELDPTMLRLVPDTDPKWHC